MADPVSLTPLRRALSLAAVYASTFGVGIAYGIGYPITALTFESWGAPAWLNGLVGSAPSLAILVCLPFFPKLVGRLGTVPSMALGCVLVGAGFLLMPILATPEAWFLLRFMMGAGIALPWLVGETWINTVTTPATRGRSLALYAVALFTAFAAGPLILEQVGIDGWLPFFVGAGGILLAVVPIVAALPLAPTMPTHPRTGVFGALWLAPVAMIAGTLGGLLEMGHFALLPVYLLQTGAGEAAALALLTLFMVGGVAFQFAIGWLADRMSARVVLIGSGLLFAAVATTLPATVDDPTMRTASILLMGGIAIGFYTLGLTHIGQRVGVADLAIANAAFLVTYQIGALVGPSLGGAMMDLWPPHGFIAAMVATTLLGAATIAVVGRAAFQGSRS